MANPTESWTPYRHQVEPTQLLTVRTRLAVGVAALEAGGDQLVPDLRAGGATGAPKRSMRWPPVILV